MRSGKWEVGSGKWEVGSGKWEVGSGKWEVRSEKWGVRSGKLFRMQFMRILINHQDNSQADCHKKSNPVTLFR